MSVVEGLGWPVAALSSPEPVGWQGDVSRETTDETVTDGAVWGGAAGERDASE